MSQSNIILRFLRSALGVLAARILSFIAVFGFNAILARNLAPEDFGIFILLCSLAGLASLIACAGMNRALVRVLAEIGIPDDPKVTRRVVNMGLGTGIVGGFIVGLVAFAIAFYVLPVAESRYAACVAALLGCVIWLRTIHLVVAETARGFHEKVASNLYGGPAGGPFPHIVFLVLLVFYFWLSDRQSVVSVLTIYLAAFVITLPPLLWRVYTLKPSGAVKHTTSGDKLDLSFGAILAISIPLMFSQTFGLTMSQADIWLAGALGTPVALALYCAAQRMLAFLTIPLQIAGTAIVSFVPELVHLKKFDKLQQMVGLAATGAGLPGLFIGCLFLLFPEIILTIAFGSYYASGAHLLQILAIGQMICIFTGPCEIVLMMAGYQSRTLIVNSIAAFLIFTLGPLGVVYYGMTGLAVALSFVTSAQNLCNWILAKRLVGISTNVGAVDFRHFSSISRIKALLSPSSSLT